ncbi:glycoside hydrolase 5 family protein [Curtobacterium sp. Leaf261]|uniref:glycoside hydrolase 5 family protein n=1 Tax=Curtobacterium sp. Leaf261 TaxID=1736311 RepID=UPI0006FCDACD|nr:glycosyl hydrolase [Curtobacterium sp. Leaf261]KQO61195.1 glycosyl hydrolase [Curtobacterium sp. Leaf261]
MRFGVNYTPAVGWFHSWLDFTPSDVARDLEQIASLGVDHVRIFPLWPLIQPNRTLIRSSALEDVATVVDIAGSFGLDVNVDALQGHLSSFDFVPSWLESWHRRNMFTEPSVVASTASYVEALAAAVADRPNLLGITIGNEVNQFAHAPHPTPHAVSPAEASTWAATMVAAARAGLAGRDELAVPAGLAAPDGLEGRLDSGGSAHAGAADGLEGRLDSAPSASDGPWVTLAQYDAAWYDDAQPFGPDHAADHGDMTVTHSWVFNGAARVHGPLGAGSVRHGEYLLQLAAAWGADADADAGAGGSRRPNWLQEVGAPTNVVPVADAADFLEGTIRHAADVQDLFGITWWCSHDVSRSLADFPELEYDLGLFTNAGELKPTGERFAALAREFGGSDRGPALAAARGRTNSGSDPAGTPGSGILDDRRDGSPGPVDALVLDDVDELGRPNPGFRAECAPGGRFALAWVDLAEALGRGPRVVLRSRLAEPGLQAGPSVPVGSSAPAGSSIRADGLVLHRVPAGGESIHMSVAHPATMP